MSNVTHTNVSCHTHESVMSHVRLSHVTYTYESSHKEFDDELPKNHHNSVGIELMNASWHTCMYESWHTYQRLSSRMCRSYGTNMIKSCHTYD